MPTYQRKNSTVEAYRLQDTPESQRQLINWANGACTYGRYPNWLLVTTATDTVDCAPGSYVVWHSHKGIAGFEVLSHDKFLELYEAD